MIVPVSVGFILIMLLFGGVLGEMIFENIIFPILVIAVIILVAWLIKKLFGKVSDGMYDFKEYYDEDDGHSQFAVCFRTEVGSLVCKSLADFDSL